MNTAASPMQRFLAAELDLLGVLEVVIARSPKVLKNGLPNLAFFRAGNAALAQPDNELDGVGFGQVEFWLSLCRALELVAAVDSKLEVTPAADDFFALSSGERMEALRRAWIHSRDLNEFALSPDIELPALRKGRTVDVTWDVPSPERLVDGRRELINVIESLPGEMPLPRLLHALEREHTNLFINHDNDGSWRQVYYRGIRERGGREDVEREGNWELVEGAIVRLMCTLPLSRLGWIDFDDSTLAITPLADAPAEDPAFEVVVQPNFEIVALGDRPDPAVLWRLARFTTPQPDGRVRKYLLERKPFADALGRGASAVGLTDFVAGLSRSPIPQNVRFSLNDWAALSERIKIWPDALLVEAEGVEELAKALPATLLSTLSPTSLTGGHYVCTAPDASTLRGVMPPRRNALDYSRRLPPVIAPTDGTDLVAPREELHLRARQLLALVSVNRGTDRYELDSALVKQSAVTLGPEELLRRIREGMSRPLSAPLLLALRAWSGEFAPPYAGGAEVLLAENHEQAALLEELPELSRWVERRLAPGVYLLRPNGSGEIRRILEKLGIALRPSSASRRIAAPEARNDAGER
ncbi:MAG: hypothetical protein K8I27_15980 [Planctomycetes bacterium]|nr:hypothetical protein [Planctomycetota bacterium]